MKAHNPTPLTFELNWKISLFALLLLPILIGLGFWQLNRAEEKSQLQNLSEQQSALPPLHLSSASNEELSPYRKVFFQAKIHKNHVFLLENQVYRGRLGFHLVVPVSTENEQILLVNAGWIPAPLTRTEIPEIPNLPEQAVISGWLRIASDNRLLRQQTISEHWPKKILQLDHDLLEESLGKKLLPWIIQLEDGHPMAQIVHWPVMNMSADKHRGYAIQWFLMAIALVVLWFFANTNMGQRNNNNNEECL